MTPLYYLVELRDVLQIYVDVNFVLFCFLGSMLNILDILVIWYC
jgi:hypothetical protein